MKNARKTILTYSGTLMWFTRKNQKILGNSRSTRLEPRLNQIFKNPLTRSENDHGGFQQQSSQRLVHVWIRVYG